MRWGECGSEGEFGFGEGDGETEGDGKGEAWLRSIDLRRGATIVLFELAGGIRCGLRRAASSGSRASRLKLMSFLSYASSRTALWSASVSTSTTLMSAFHPPAEA